MLELIGKGLLIGILVSAPLGPVGILCIQRTLAKGRWHGFSTGAGATLSDIIYATLTSLGMGAVTHFIETNHHTLQLAGSTLLALFGYCTYRNNPVKKLRKQKDRKISHLHDTLTGFLLALSNALILLLYIALFAQFRFITPGCPPATHNAAIAALGTGATLWWLAITGIIARMKKWFNIRNIWILNKITGAILLLIALAGILATSIHP
jgi:threonine/homoserine/homoserine lactone efflux protein